jgi:N6-L-threonylcarbamoyladenine synthase
MNAEPLILAFETSCDETAASVYQQSRGVCSNVLFSQIELHKSYGGVVPEIASRSHLEQITPITTCALREANVRLADIDVIAVTNKPGLPGSLLIGVCFAKAIAASANKKLIGVNHLEGHIFSSCIDQNIPFPHLCLTASGGHTALYLVNGLGDYTLVGHTFDDAAGEALDKVAKLLQLPYPGGPIIEQLAQTLNFQDFFNYPRSKLLTPDFSFSGLKTAVLYDLVKRGAYDLAAQRLLPGATAAFKAQVASSLLACVADIFTDRLAIAHKQYSEVRAITFVGGVACNQFLRTKIGDWCTARELLFVAPPKKYCSDNAAMIAFVGNYKAQRQEFSSLELDIL